MNRFEEYDRELLVRRVRRHREALREAGMRPVQLWVPDARKDGFAAECRRQCAVANQLRSTCRPKRRRGIKLQRGDLVAWSYRRSTAPPEHGMVIQHEAFLNHAYVAIVPVVWTHSAEPNDAPLLNVSVCDRLRMRDLLYATID